MRKSLFFLIILLTTTLALSTRLSASDNNKYIVSSVSTNLGLSNNTVQAILQDRSGLVWIGTKDGLDRYDGKNLRHVSPKDGLNENNYVLSLCEDNAGNLWIGTSAGICFYDSETETETRFPLGLENVDDAEIPVYQIVMDNDGSIWIPAGQAGFIRIFPDSREVVQFSQSADGTVPYYGSAICHDEKNTFYFVMDDGDVYLSTDHLSSAAPLLGRGILKFRPHFLRYSFGKLFTGTAEEDIMIDLHDKTVKNTSWAVLKTSGENRKDELWVARDNGISVLNNELKETVRLVPDFDNRLTLQGKSVICMCSDHEGDLWVGTFYAGAFHLVKNRANLQRYYPRSESDVLGSHVRQILPESDGTVWITTEDKGLVRFFPDKETFTPVPLPFHTKNVQCVCSDGDFLWVGSFSIKDPLARLDKRTGRVELFKDSPRRLYSICRTSDGTLFIGHSEGLSYLQDGEFHHLPIISRVVHEVMEDSRGELWVSSGHDGLWHCNGKNWKDESSWEQFRHAPEDSGSISSNIVTSAFEDNRSQIWVTTESGGFCRMNPATGRFVRYDFPTSFKMSQDSKGLLWITTIKGLLCFNPQTGASHLLTMDDGMLSNQYNYSSNVIAPDGTLYAGSVDGFISFNPDIATQLDFNTRIILSSFSVIRNSDSHGTGAAHLNRSINSVDRLTLKFNENSFRIGVATVNYSVPRNSYLTYFLEPYSTQWRPVSDGTIEFDDLPPGQYTLKVRSTRLDGTIEPGEKTLLIEVRRPIFASIPAFAIYILLFLAAILVTRKIVKRVTSRKMQEDKEKVEMEKEKTLYAAKFDFITKIAHEIRTPLSLIRGPLEDIRDKMPANAGKELHEDVDIACSNSERLHELLGQLLDFSAIEKVGYSPNAEVIDLTELTRSICKRFSSSIKSRNLDFNLALPAGPLMANTDKDAFDKISSNLLSNAVKYAGTFLKVSLAADANTVKLTVENDGVIIPEHMREQIFKPFVRYSGNTHVVEGTGIGLATSRTLAEVLGGTLSVDSSTEVNRFVARLPLTMKPAAESGNTGNGTALPVPVRSDSRKNILVVEDNAELRNFLTRQLSGEFNVETASDGKEALEKMENNGFEIVVSDVMMPNLNGLELCQKMKGNILFSHIPIILLTAKTDIESKIEGMKFGADIYIEKPFSIKYLISTVESVLYNRALLRKHYLANPMEVEPNVSNSEIDSNFLKSLSDFISRNISNEDLKVKDIASATCMSESNLFRKTKDLLGMRPNEYLQFIRLKTAAQILLKENASISDICLRVGFSSHSYFSNCFKKQFGVTPNEYRNSAGKDCKDIDN